MRYRPEIDGLRAVAVLPVMLFHAGFGAFAGGFVGVDVFFVISGYLITSKILHERATAGFSLLAFYEGRARRLLPALFVVMAACCLPACLWMLPGDLERFGKSLIATSLFANNLYLLRTSNYWAADSEFKPLLHTWSLAVEEQFYLAFPLVLLAVWRFVPQRAAILFLAAAVASLALAVWPAAMSPPAVFYLLPTRIWELLLGALAALHPRNGRPAAGAAATAVDQTLGLAGLILIGWACVTFRINAVNPNLWTLMPTLGAVLVILHGRSGTLAFRLLGSRPLVGIGLISYSLYLWHHPLLAFARIRSADPPGAALVTGLVLAAFPLAWLSWAFVERPFRSRSFVGPKPVLAGFALASAAFLAAGSVLVATRGLPGRVVPEDIATTDALYIDYNERAFAYRKTAFARPEALHVLVLGNSYARDTVNMLVETFDLARVEIAYRDDLPVCLASWTDDAALRDGADIVVLSRRTFDPSCLAENIERAERTGTRVFYVGTKHFGANLNWLMRLDPEARRNRFNRLLPQTIRQEERMAGTVPSAHYVSLLAPVVRDGRVPITDEAGRLLTPDRTHLTRFGARYFGERVLRASALGQAIAADRVGER